MHLSGSFGRVRLCRNKKSGEYFAMKILKKADIIKLKQVDHVISENTILADIDHPFLVSRDCIFVKVTDIFLNFL
jgi:protein kinase A